jgi:hypothetical protein
MMVMVMMMMVTMIIIIKNIEMNNKNLVRFRNPFSQAP